MKRKRKEYDKEFKLMAVNLCYIGKTATEVGQELGVQSGLISRWKREYESNKEGSFSGNGNPVMSDTEKEIARLKKELKEAQLEREILKKVVSIFSRSDSKNTSL